jgi:hypothetical protein
MMHGQKNIKKTANNNTIHQIKKLNNDLELSNIGFNSVLQRNVIVTEKPVDL